MAEINSDIPSISLFVIVDAVVSTGVARRGPPAHCAIGLVLYLTDEVACFLFGGEGA